MKCPIIPGADKVVVLRDPAKTKTESGILLPDSAKERAVHGKLLAITFGESIGKVKSDVTVGLYKPGRGVYFTKYAGVEVEAYGETYLILDFSEILGIDDEDSA